MHTVSFPTTCAPCLGAFWFAPQPRLTSLAAIEALWLPKRPRQVSRVRRALEAARRYWGFAGYTGTGRLRYKAWSAAYPA